LAGDGLCVVLVDKRQRRLRRRQVVWHYRNHVSRVEKDFISRNDVTIIIVEPSERILYSDNCGRSEKE